MREEVSVLYKKKLVETLKAFDEFCTESGLNYFACSGTAIGAVRHKGFIPWDDDIDVYMLREDYDRLIKIRNNLFETHYRIAEMGDEGYIYSFAKFYDSNTTLVEVDEYPTCCIGVYVDIFPLDEVSGNIEEVKQKKEEYEKLFDQYQLTYRTPKLYWILANAFHFNFAFLWKRLYPRYCSRKKKEQIRQRFMDYEMKWREEKGEKLFFHHALYKTEKEIFEKEWFHSYLYMPFEDYQVRVNTEYDKYLTRLFGDYMTPPPVEQQVSHHFHYYLNLKEGLSLSQVKERISKGEKLVY